MADSSKMIDLGFSAESMPAKITVRKVRVDQILTLRHTVLWPNKPFSYVRLPEDDVGHHYGAFLPSEDVGTPPVAVISVFVEPLPETSDTEINGLVTATAARFRKFACDPKYQNQGIGSSLLHHVFTTTGAELSCTVIWCDARLTTQHWYERRGMRAFGGTFFKGEVEYVRMLRSL